MATSRRRRGFERAGACSIERLGLPSRRTRELELALAWQAAAGITLAARCRAVAVRRGVLEVEITDARWEAVLTELLPRLARRVASRCPGRGIRACRLIVEREVEAARRARDFELAPEEDRRNGHAPSDPRSVAVATAPPPDPPADRMERLRRLARCYATRAEARDLRSRSGRAAAGPSDQG